MTDEGKALTEKWVDSNGAKYPYAYDKGGKLARWFDVGGIPTAALIDPNGTILWRGHPGTLTEKEIERAIEGSISVPLWDWPKSAKAAAKAMSKGDWAKALEEAKKASADDIAASIQGFLEKKVEAMNGANEEGNYLRAFTLAKALKKGLSGLPQADEASALYERLKSDKDAQAVISLQEKLAKISEKAGGLGKPKEVEKLKEKVRKLRKELPGTYAEVDADALLERLEALRLKLIKR